MCLNEVRVHLADSAATFTSPQKDTMPEVAVAAQLHFRNSQLRLALRNIVMSTFGFNGLARNSSLRLLVEHLPDGYESSMSENRIIRHSGSSSRICFAPRLVSAFAWGLRVVLCFAAFFR